MAHRSRIPLSNRFRSNVDIHIGVDILKTSGSPDLFSPELDAGDNIDNHGSMIIMIIMKVKKNLSRVGF